MNDTPLAKEFAAAGAGHKDSLITHLDSICSCVHNVKGNAALIKFDYFQKRASDFESKIAQSELRSDLAELEDLRRKFPRSFQRQNVSLRYGDGRARDEVVVALDEFVKATAKKLGKEVRLDAAGFDTQLLSEGQRSAVRDVLVQLARNSLVHGIESPQERAAAGKDRQGTLMLRPVRDRSGEFGFTFRDDGRGLDLKRIRDCALAKHFITPEAGAAMTGEQVVGLIFETGFSTDSAAGAESGRGLGMNVVRRRIVDECDGSISVLSDTGHYCEFEIGLPLRALVHA